MDNTVYFVLELFVVIPALAGLVYIALKCDKIQRDKQYQKFLNDIQLLLNK